MKATEGGHLLVMEENGCAHRSSLCRACGDDRMPRWAAKLLVLWLVSTAIGTIAGILIVVLR